MTEPTEPMVPFERLYEVVQQTNDLWTQAVLAVVDHNTAGEIFLNFFRGSVALMMGQVEEGFRNASAFEEELAQIDDALNKVLEEETKEEE